MRHEVPREIVALRKLSSHQVHELETFMLKGLRAARMHRFGWILFENGVHAADIARLTEVHRSSVDGWFPHWGCRHPGHFEPVRIRQWNLDKLIGRFESAWEKAGGDDSKEERLDSAVAFGTNYLERRLVKVYDSRKESQPTRAALRFADSLSGNRLVLPAQAILGNGDFEELMAGRRLPVAEFMAFIEEKRLKNGVSRAEAEGAARRLAVLRARSLLPISMAQQCLVDVVDRYNSNIALTPQGRSH